MSKGKIDLRKKPVATDSDSAVRADAELEALKRELEKAKTSSRSSSSSSSSTSSSSSHSRPSKSVTESKAVDAEIEEMRRKLEELERSKDRGRTDDTSLKELRREAARPVESKTKGEIEKLRADLAGLGGSKTSASKNAEIERLERELAAASSASAGRAGSRAALDSKLSATASRLEDKLNGVDVCFLMDCTGSMDAWIVQTKDKVEDIARKILEANKGRIKIRMAFVGYRDHCDAERFSIFPFSESVVNLSRFLGGVVATGGGDGPEDVAGGFAKAKELDWFSSARVVIHFADAPCHGSKYHSMTDDYPRGDPGGLVPEKLLQQMKAMHIDYYFVRINSFTDAMIDVFRTTGCQVTQLELEANSREFVPKIVMSVTSSISASRARAKDLLS